MELVDDQSQSSEAPPRGKIEERKEDVGRVVTTRGPMKKVGMLGSLRGRRPEMTQSYASSSQGSEVPFEF